eukprot:TRINITY_DN17613_c0_g1_i1.p1 TRINITY_DN17613_c0_g1~~TRINITY_DN17613_c0_g1_i1.p1  ORF type:complete len:184 (-),score=68.12 TRINITY_DN17613_c0_g1_i1:156-659(-)
MVAGLIFILAGVAAAAGHGYPHHGYHPPHGYHPLKHPKCTKKIETVTRQFCRLEIEKSCKTESKTFFKITGFEDKDCKDIEVCKHGYGYHGHGYHGYHGYHGKREAHAPVECEKETKEICKKIPVKEEVTKDIEFCKGTPKKVCEDKEVKIPKITCERPEEKSKIRT